ncbi:molybdopterin/thiamine biosynthesis adenylyltransferase [Oceanisphaera litoralis]|uniref:HesA/MoeB/ThiF family protein n=1 Tax=Oceanisphaera litoralis TaxID=225144 RepID=UPI001957928A|nr:molybdopterin-synthase adenylyltransferase MoeB [Oceanisphaera litoralis]MBM7456983.1 molybdopterin/thiamine biosynthesis adenylyltransferase [Oceanisphaera litoralis]
MLSDGEFMRYSRHLLLEEVGEEGQLKLKQASVLVVGLGGLGSPAVQYLAAAGVGTLWLADFDHIEVSNLQRQTLYDMDSLQHSKAETAREKLLALNPEIEVIAINQKLDERSLGDFVAEVDLVLDCTDNITIRQNINAACYAGGTPLLVGAAIRFEGQLLALDPARDHGCYRCLYGPDIGERLNCSNSGVIGPVVGTIGLLQALEAIKFFTDTGSVPWGELKLFDAKAHRWHGLKVPKDPACPVCGTKGEEQQCE